MSEQKILLADQVFGINRDLPLNYKERPSADHALVGNLSRKKHLVIYGSSKQGKTSLRKHCLKEEDYLLVHCSNKWTVAEVNSAILKKAGYEITLSASKTVSGKSKILASLSATFFGAGAKVDAEKAVEKTEAISKKPMELDPYDVNDIIAALNNLGLKKFIVLEDFHYLPIETQRDFAVALKAFHEASDFCFIIIGVWLEESRLTVYNGDLTGRVISINADLWKKEELKEVIKQGEALLNIRFTDSFIEKVLERCFDSVYIVQEACYQCCVLSGVNETQTVFKTIGDGIDADRVIKEVVNQQTGRFNSFITQFAEGFQDTTWEMYKWILFPILTSSTSALEEGLKLSEIRRSLQNHHPQGMELNRGNLTQSLQSAASLQVKKEIKPIILDYDQTNLRLNVVDKGFLIWISNQERKELLELAGLPLE